MVSRGSFPTTVRVHVERHAPRDLPRAMRVGDCAATKLWLLDKFQTKEQHIQAGLGTGHPVVADAPGTARASLAHLVVGLVAVAASLFGLWTQQNIRTFALTSCALWQGLALFGGLDDVAFKLTRSPSGSESG